MDQELKLDLVKTEDVARFTRAGGTVRERQYVFYLGAHGPLTFRTPLEPFNADAFPQYVAEQRAHLLRAQGA